MVRQEIVGISITCGELVIDSGVPRAIIGFHLDEEGHWVADLECGHTRHVRHDPPWQVREWVTTPEGRASWLGRPLGCVRCERGER